MSRYLLLVLASAAALPAAAQPSSTAKPAPALQRLHVSIGSFLLGNGDSDRHTQFQVRYTPYGGLHLPLKASSVYLESNRHKTTTGTGTTAVGNLSAFHGVGLTFNSHLLPLQGSRVYQFTGVGVYQRGLSVGTNHRRGFTLGGKLGVGYLKDSVFAEVDYTLVGRVLQTDSSGLSLRFGVRL